MTLSYYKNEFTEFNDYVMIRRNRDRCVSRNSIDK